MRDDELEVRVPLVPNSTILCSCPVGVGFPMRGLSLDLELDVVPKLEVRLEKLREAGFTLGARR